MGARSRSPGWRGWGWCCHPRRRSGQTSATGRWMPGTRPPQRTQRECASLPMPRKSSAPSLLRLTLLRRFRTLKSHRSGARFQLGPRNTTCPRPRMRDRHRPRQRPHRPRLFGTASGNDIYDADSGQEPTRAWPTWQQRAERSRPWPIFTVRLPSGPPVPRSLRSSAESGLRSRTGRPNQRDRPCLQSRRPRPRPRWTRAS